MSKLTNRNVKVKENKKLVNSNLKFSNYDVSFQLYEKGKHKKKLKNLKKEEIIEFEKIILKVINCKNENEFSRCLSDKNIRIIWWNRFT